MPEVVYGTLDLKPKSICDQLKKLGKHFPNVKFEIPENGSEGFVYPKWESIAPTYEKALLKVFARIDAISGGNFKNFNTSIFGPKFLRQTERTRLLFEKAYLIQSTENCIVLPSQLGLLYLGKSPNEITTIISGNREAALGLFHVAVVILTHYDRIAGGDDLWINCCGDEIRALESSEYNFVPFFVVNKNKITVCTQEKATKNERFGSATANFEKY